MILIIYFIGTPFRLQVLRKPNLKEMSHRILNHGQKTRIVLVVKGFCTKFDLDLQLRLNIYGRILIIK